MHNDHAISYREVGGFLCTLVAEQDSCVHLLRSRYQRHQTYSQRCLFPRPRMKQTSAVSSPSFRRGYPTLRNAYTIAALTRCEHKRSLRKSYCGSDCLCTCQIVKGDIMIDRRIVHVAKSPETQKQSVRPGNHAVVGVACVLTQLIETEGFEC